MRALSLAPGDRFPSAAAFEAEIDQCLSKLLNRPSDRDVGTMLAQAFAQERANISSLIEAELSAPKSGRAALPVLPIASATNVSPGPPVPTSSPDSSSLEDPVRAGANVGITNPPARVGRRGVVIGGSVAAAFVVGGLVWAIASGRGSAPATAVPSATTLAPLVEGAPTVRGVTDGEILMGMSAAFSGPSRDLGTRMKLGIDTAFSDENDRGGILGRKLTLVALDDGYEGKRALDNMHELVEKRGVFAFIGNVGTPTAQQTVPYANSIKTLFFGAFTGASLLRQQPPDRYVFNYRASYEEETSKMVQYLAAAKHIGPEAVVVFAQHDAYGDAGFNGVAKAMRKLGRADVDILRVNYERNTVDVDAAVSDVMKYHNAADVIRIGNSDVSKPKHPVQAIIMIASYKAAAKFIQKIRDRRISPIFANVSFVGSTALAEELKEQGKNYGAGVIVTQVVPHYESGGSSIIRYREALAKFSPDQQPDFISLEGFVVGKLFAEAVKRAGHDLNEEKVVDTLEAMKEVDLGVGTPLTFGPSEHQASHAVWGTVLDDQMHFLPLDMD
jgi:ABC-type branched-subunit amino acid transport system substrate-binding protein